MNILELKQLLIDKITEKEEVYVKLKAATVRDEIWELEREYRALDKEVIDLINNLTS